MPKRRSGECAYCGENKPLTDDHIPPQCLFSSHPADILEVPSCSQCNNGASLDDEYFKTIMVMKDRAGSHPGAVAIRSSVFRALHKPKKVKFAQAIVRSLRTATLRTPAGLYAGQHMAFDVDLIRLRRVVARVTKGLFWHHRGTRLPCGFEAIVYSEDDLSSLGAVDLEETQREVLTPVLNQPAHSIGAGVFRYWYLFASDHEHASAWVFEFYGDVRFAALTIERKGPNKDLQPSAAGAIMGRRG